MTGLKAIPRENELLSSWLIRSAVLNGTDPIGWCGGIWLDWRPWTTDIDRHLPLNRLEKLSVFSGLSVETLRNMTLEPTVELLSGINEMDPKKSWPWVIPTGERNRNRTNGLHFCPECLAEKNAYFKKEWRLSWNIACEKHKRLLALHCPTCNTVFSPHLVRYDIPTIYMCTSCGEDLRQIKTDEANHDVLLLQEHLNQSLVDAHVPYCSREDRSVDGFLFAREVMIFVRNFRRQEQRFSELLDEFNCQLDLNLMQRTLGSNIDSIDIKERESLLAITASIIKLDQHAIIELLRRHNIAKGVFDPNSSVSSNKGKAILQKLSDNDRTKTVRVHKQRGITPRTREEVEELMDREIRPFL